MYTIVNALLVGLYALLCELVFRNTCRFKFSTSFFFCGGSPGILLVAHYE
jgi:hypothetical protein